MTSFSATTESTAVVAAAREDIWAVLTDPALLAELTPLLRRIDADGDRWRWEMSGLEVLGLRFAPAFTERMSWVPGRRIGFTHEPPPGVAEQAGAQGHYELADTPEGTRLSILLRLDVDLPLPRLAAPAVRSVMSATMRVMGDRFAANLLAHLDRAPQPVAGH
jgi:carbon monoxide dehydrogenase subunit G